MMIQFTWLAAVAAEKTAEGGLFDFDATLPLMALQFLLLMAVLNAIFYKPLSAVLDKRADYIRQNLAEARDRQEKALGLAQKYEQELRDVRRQSQELIATAQQEAQSLVDAEIQRAEQEVQVQRQQAAQEIAVQKAAAMQALEQQVDSLSQQILAKLLEQDLLVR